MPTTKNTAYAQLSSSLSQQPKTLDPVKIIFNINDGIYGIEHSENKNNEDIKVLNDGVYMVIAAGQIGRTSGSLLRFVDIWLAINGNDVSNSNVRGSVPASLFVGDTYVLMTQSALNLKAGDVVNVRMSVSVVDNGLGLIATKPEQGPTIPSIIFTMHKI